MSNDPIIKLFLCKLICFRANLVPGTLHRTTQGQPRPLLDTFCSLDWTWPGKKTCSTCSFCSFYFCLSHFDWLFVLISLDSASRHCHLGCRQTSRLRRETVAGAPAPISTHFAPGHISLHRVFGKDSLLTCPPAHAQIRWVWSLWTSHASWTLSTSRPCKQNVEGRNVF